MCISIHKYGCYFMVGKQLLDERKELKYIIYIAFN